SRPQACERAGLWGSRFTSFRVRACAKDPAAPQSVAVATPNKIARSCTPSVVVNFSMAYPRRHQSARPVEIELEVSVWISPEYSGVPQSLGPTPGRSMRGHVGITQDVGLTLQILQTVLD